jgi:predicted nucleic acid-binding protein
MAPAAIAILDACVLYSAPIRDLLIRLAQADLIRARWTTEIHEEWMRNLLHNRPDLTRQCLERTRALMDNAVRDCLVTEYEELVDSILLPDRDDRHVLAAAIKAGADVILTFNLDDFPEDSLALHGLRAQHPDEFVSQLLDVAPAIVCSAARNQRESLRRPAVSVSEFLSILERLGLPETVAALRRFVESI